MQSGRQTPVERDRKNRSQTLLDAPLPRPTFLPVLWPRCASSPSQTTLRRLIFLISVRFNSCTYSATVTQRHLAESSDTEALSGFFLLDSYHESSFISRDRARDFASSERHTGHRTDGSCAPNRLWLNTEDSQNRMKSHISVSIYRHSRDLLPRTRYRYLLL